jgi:hypothetical protein
MWSLRHDRRLLPPCFATSHSRGPHRRSPVLSTNRCTGPEPDRGGSFSVSARRLKVEWSGTARSRPSSWRTELISTSVWRSAKRNTARSVSAVAIARSELPAPSDARRRCPGRDCLRREPDGQVAAGTQGGVILDPVGYPVPLLRNVMRRSARALNGKRSAPAWWRGLAPISTYPKALRRLIPATRWRQRSLTPAHAGLVADQGRSAPASPNSIGQD